MKLSNYQSALVTIPMIEGFSESNSSPDPLGRRFRHSTIKGLYVRVCRVTKNEDIVVFLEDFTGFAKRIVFSNRKKLRLDLEKSMLEYWMYRL